MQILSILSRWIHIVSACILVGGFFFMRYLIPAQIPAADNDIQLNTRKRFKIAVHSTITFLLLTGIFNSYIAFAAYSKNPQILHPLWGTHILLALIAIAISFIALAGSRENRKLLAINFLILLAAIAVASTLKSFREKVLASAPAGAHP